MLTATPSSGPATFVAINGMISTNGTATQLTVNPSAMLTVPPNFGTSGFLSNSNIAPTSFILPSSFPQGANLACPPFTPTQYPGSIFPFLNSTGPGMFHGNAIPSLLPQLIQSQSSTNPLATFSNAIPVNSMVGSFNAHSQTDTTVSATSNIITGSNFPTTCTLLPLPPLNLPTSNNAALAGLAGTTPFSAASFASLPVPISCVSVSKNSSKASLTTTSSTTSGLVSSEPVTISPSLQNTFKIDKNRPTLYGGNSAGNGTCPVNLAYLESVDFHRDEILDAIDRLRERKARPDFERISCMLKRYRNINPDQTQVCLGRLAASGAVVCVDYKGNISYRNPSKWRKTSVNLGTTNPPGVSQRLVDAVRYLMKGSVDGIVTSSSSSTIAIPAPVGPNGGYSLFQIERALQTLKSNPNYSNKPTPELTGATLRVCLDREAVNGKLAKTSDGRYILDESGERKKLSTIAVNQHALTFNKRPLPPNGSTLLLPNTLNQKTGKIPNTVACIAPAGDFSPRPLLAKQSSVAVSIAPLGGKPFAISPLTTPQGRSLIGRRGRPPGSKARRPSSTSNAMSSEKKSKLDVPVSSAPGSSTDSPLTTADSPQQNGTTVLASKPILTSSVLAVSQTNFNSPSIMSLQTPFINGTGSMTGLLPAPLLSPAFSSSHSIDATTFSTTFASHFLSFPACPTGLVPASVPTSDFASMFLPASLPCSLPMMSNDDELSGSTTISNLEMGVVHPEEDGESRCVQCGAGPTTEDPFLVCKDCNSSAHPTCLDYWPELTERARQSEWQCAGCKTCSVCQDAQSSTNLLVCDACDKGFHPGCHDPKVEEPVDRSLPWVCTACRNEGYSVAIGTMPNETSDQFCPGTSVHSKESEHSDGEDTEVNVTEVDDELETAVVDSPKFKHSPAKYECNEHSPSIGTRAVVSLESSSSLAGSPNSFKTPREQTLSTPKTEDNESGIKASISPKSAEQDIKTDRPESNRSVAPDPFEEDTNRVQECPTAIRTWSVEHVRDWLLREGFAREAEAFYQQEIDGACLLLMKRMDVLTELGIKLGPAVKIYERIRRLQSNCTSSSSPMSS